MPARDAGRVARALLALALAAACSLAYAGDAERRYELSGRGYLRLAVPEGWLDEVRERAPQSPPTIVFRPLEGTAFLVMVTPIWRASPGVRLPGREGLRERVERGIEIVRPRAVEKEIAVSEFEGASGAGFYYSATDRAPRTGEYLYLTQGMLRVGELVVMFTVLANADRDSLVENALRMLKGAAHLPE